MAKKTSQSRYITESERNTVALKFRVEPEIAERFRALAKAWGCKNNEAFTSLVEQHTEESTE